MGFLSDSDEIRLGDTVIIHIDFNTQVALLVDPNTSRGPVIQVKYGQIIIKDLVGLRYGSKYSCKKGFVYLLRATPELWTRTLPFRTQILYLPDISMIIVQLDLKPGSIVGESGTGSGSLSHSIARTIAPNGHLYTFDFHDLRVQQAKKEFAEHGLESVITVQHSDVCSSGFGDLASQLDAILLDLPAPWGAVLSAKKALKRNGSRLGSFSPCIEQVQKMCSVLREEGFSDVCTMEVLMRPLEVKPIAMNSWIPPEDKKDDGEKKGPKTPFSQATFLTTVVPRDVPGHSGYLTFASLF